MTHAIDKGIIALLALTVCFLAWKLLAKDSRNESIAPMKRDDPLNLAGFEERQNRFDREIQSEERLGKR